MVKKQKRAKASLATKSNRWRQQLTREERETFRKIMGEKAPQIETTQAALFELSSVIQEQTRLKDRYEHERDWRKERGKSKEKIVEAEGWIAITDGNLKLLDKLRIALER